MSSQFEAFIAPARRRPQLWRLVVGLGFCFVIYGTWVAATIGGTWQIFGRDLPPRVWASVIAGAQTEVGALVLLATFLGMALGPMLTVRIFHKRGAATLFGRPATTLRGLATGTAFAGAILLVSVAVWSIWFDPVSNLDPALWAALLPLTLPAILIQTGAEEILFRGYIQQQLAARFRHPLFWLVLPSVVFGLVHYDPTSALVEAWLVVGSATIFGLMAADLTARSGSIGAAWGLHFANNVVALAIVPTQGTIEALGLFTTPYSLSDLGNLRWLFVVDLAVLALAWWLIRRWVSR